MIKLRNTCCLAIVLATVLATMFSSASAAPVVIAGSELSAPPAFWDSSFYPLTSRIERAFPFSVAPGDSYFVEELQIAAFHYQGLAGNRASFTIRKDAQGEPGDFITAFLINDITTTAQVHSLVPSENFTLSSGNTYWIVGRTGRGQVNWNLGDNAFGETGFRLDGGEWSILQGRNIAAYAILGTPVPEPSSIALVGCMTIAVACCRKRRYLPLP